MRRGTPGGNRRRYRSTDPRHRRVAGVSGSMHGRHTTVVEPVTRGRHPSMKLRGARPPEPAPSAARLMTLSSPPSPQTRLPPAHVLFRTRLFAVLLLVSVWTGGRGGGSAPGVRGSPAGGSAAAHPVRGPGPNPGRALSPAGRGSRRPGAAHGGGQGLDYAGGDRFHRRRTEERPGFRGGGRPAGPGPGRRLGRRPLLALRSPGPGLGPGRRTGTRSPWR